MARTEKIGADELRIDVQAALADYIDESEHEGTTMSFDDFVVYLLNRNED